MFNKMTKNCTINGTSRISLKGTNRGVHNHHFHAGIASR